jgi:hypothetical protein
VDGDQHALEQYAADYQVNQVLAIYPQLVQAALAQGLRGPARAGRNRGEARAPCLSRVLSPPSPGCQARPVRRGAVPSGNDACTYFSKATASRCEALRHKVLFFLRTESVLDTGLAQRTLMAPFMLQSTIASVPPLEFRKTLHEPFFPHVAIEFPILQCGGHRLVCIDLRRSYAR